MPVYDENGTTDWTPQPKIIAAGLVGIAVYVLGAFGVDLGEVVQDVANAIDVDVPDQQAFAALFAALIAGYIKKND